MAVVIRSMDEDSVALPADVMTDLNLHDGDRVKIIVEGQTIRFASLDKFLALRGILGR